MKDKKTITGFLHGECLIKEAKIPADAVLEEHNELRVIIAESEVTGNHHVIDRKAGVEFLKTEGKRFMRNSVPTQVSCVISERHTAIDIPPGEWEIGAQQEYDYITQMKQNVAD